MSETVTRTKVVELPDWSKKKAFSAKAYRLFEVKRTIQELEDEKKALEDYLKPQLSQTDAEAVVADGLKVMIVSSKGQGRINGKTLLELGVQSKIIEQATERTPYSFVKVTAVKDDKEA